MHACILYIIPYYISPYTIVSNLEKNKRKVEKKKKVKVD